MRIVSAKRSWTLGASLSQLHQDIHASTYRLRRVSWQNEGRRLISGLPGRIKARGPRMENTRGRLRHGLSRHHASTPAPQKQINIKPGLLPNSCKKNGGQIRSGEGRAKCLNRNT